MADVTISSLSALTPSTGLVLPVSNGSTTGSVTLSQVCGVMTSAQITSALGYTPYNSTNPAGYISSSSRPGFTAGQSSGSIANGNGGLGGIELQGAGGGNAAFLCFHRPGAYAAYLGLDSDNQFKVGGWSMGANSYTLLHTGNTNPSGFVKAWANFDGNGGVGTNQSIRASFNISSIYKEGDGLYRVYFASPLADSNYVVSGVNGGQSASYLFNLYGDGPVQTPFEFRCCVVYPGNRLFSTNNIQFMVIR